MGGRTRPGRCRTTDTAVAGSSRSRSSRAARRDGRRDRRIARTARRAPAAPAPPDPLSREEAQPDRPGGVVGVRVEEADRLPGPEGQAPSMTGTVSDGGASSGRTCRRRGPGEPCRCRYSASSRGSSRSSAASRSLSEPAPTSTTTRPAVACGTKIDSSPSPPAATSATNPAHWPVRSTRPRPLPVRTVSSRLPSTGRCSGSRHGAGRGRRPPAPTRSARSPAARLAAPHPRSPTAVL